MTTTRRRNIPSERTATAEAAASRFSRAQAFLALSDKLLRLPDRHALMRETVDGLLFLLRLRAGLVLLSQPHALYSKHRIRSASLEEFEDTLRDGADLLSLFAFEENSRIHNSDGLLLMPLRWKSSTIGLMALDSAGKALSASDTAMMLMICNQLPVLLAAQNGAATQHEIQPSDLQEAMAVQQGLQPAIPSRSCGLTVATHSQAAEYVGGDYFDLLLVDPTQMGIVIADVEGKGVSAALFGNLLRTTVHFLTRESQSTAAVVGKINAILHKEAASTHKLFTLFYSVFDAATKQLRYTGSGHVSPILIRSTNGNVERLLSEGIPMGIEPSQRFQEKYTQLESDDLVVYFTDGVVECKNGAGESFGEQRFISLLRQHQNRSVESIMKIVMAELSAFGKSAPGDDITIILTKVV